MSILIIEILSLMIILLNDLCISLDKSLDVPTPDGHATTAIIFSCSKVLCIAAAKCNVIYAISDSDILEILTIFFSISHAFSQALKIS